MGNHKGDYSLLDTSKSFPEATYLFSIKYSIVDYVSCGFALGWAW